MIEKINSLKNAFKEQTPGFSVKYKDQSTLMKIISYILFFNKSFMTNFITTIGETVYFPNEEKIKNATTHSPIISLCHEYRHVTDYNSNFFKKIWFTTSYLFPQILAPLALILLPFCWWLALILFVVLLLPIPAPGRMYWELKGYITNIFVINEFHKKYWKDGYLDTRREIIEGAIGRYNENFTKANYYFMWPFGVKKYLAEAYDDCLSGKILEDDFFKDLQKTLKDCDIT